jgi:hypothetical protein
MRAITIAIRMISFPDNVSSPSADNKKQKKKRKKNQREREREIN